MRVIEQAYDEKSHGDIFEKEQARISWGSLAKVYDQWTTSCLAMARDAGGGLQEADLIVREPRSQAPPTREFKITNPKGQAHFMIVVPLFKIFMWINKEHTDTIHPDIVLVELLRIPATVVIDDKRGSIIHVRDGPTIIDTRTGEDRKRFAE